MIQPLPFFVNIPISISSTKLIFHITESMHAIGADCVSPPHNHSDFEICYLSSGTGKQVIGSDEIKLRSGDILVLHPRVTHYQTEDGISQNLTKYSIRLSINDGAGHGANALRRILDGVTHLHDNSFTLAPLFNRLWKEVSDRRPGYFNYLQALCTSILIELLRLTGEDTSEIFETDESKYTSYWRDKLDRFLHQRFADDIRLEDLAEEIALSPRHASRMITKEYGMSFIQKLTEIRLDNAKYLLRHTNRDMENISAACGFQSYSYFTTCFKKNVGITPGQYRSSLKSKV